MQYFFSFCIWGWSHLLVEVVNLKSLFTSTNKSTFPIFQFYTDYKARLNNKVRAMRNNETTAATGAEIELTTLETRLCNILGYNIKDLLTAKANPLSTTREMKKESSRSLRPKKARRRRSSSNSYFLLMYFIFVIKNFVLHPIHSSSSFWSR